MDRSDPIPGGLHVIWLAQEARKAVGQDAERFFSDGTQLLIEWAARRLLYAGRAFGTGPSAATMGDLIDFLTDVGKLHADVVASGLSDDEGHEVVARHVKELADDRARFDAASSIARRGCEGVLRNWRDVDDPVGKMRAERQAEAAMLDDDSDIPF